MDGHGGHGHGNHFAFVDHHCNFDDGHDDFDDGHEDFNDAHHGLLLASVFMVGRLALNRPTLDVPVV